MIKPWNFDWHFGHHEKQFTIEILISYFEFKTVLNYSNWNIIFIFEIEKNIKIKMLKM